MKTDIFVQAILREAERRLGVPTVRMIQAHARGEDVREWVREILAVPGSGTRSEVGSDHPGTRRLMADICAADICAAEDVVDPCHAADLAVRPDPYDGGCAEDCRQ